MYKILSNNIQSNQNKYLFSFHSSQYLSLKLHPQFRKSLFSFSSLNHPLFIQNKQRNCFLNSRFSIMYEIWEQRVYIVKWFLKMLVLPKNCPATGFTRSRQHSGLCARILILGTRPCRPIQRKPHFNETGTKLGQRSQLRWSSDSFGANEGHLRSAPRPH